MAEYYVVLGDVVHSREIEDREAFQERLAETCGRFTAASRDDVYGDFKILKGVDEFGGVLRSLENLYDVVRAYREELRPHEVRLVVASGSIDVGLASFDIEKMDGEAFHRASQRLEEIEDGPLSFDLLIEDERLGRAIADEINLLLRRRDEWTDRQREVVAVRREVETQAAAAERLGVTQQAVSNVLSGAEWPLVAAVEDRLRETLREYADSRASADATGREERPDDLVEEATLDVPAEYFEAEERFDEAGAHVMYANDLVEEGEWDEASEHYERALELDPEYAGAHLQYGNLLLRQGYVEEAADHYEQAIDVYRDSDDERGIARCLQGLGLVARRQGDYEAAREYHERSLEIKRELGNRQGEANSLGNLGLVARHQGGYEAAQEYHQQSLAIHRELGDRAGEVKNLEGLGLVAQVQGDYEEAREYHEQSLAIARKLGDRANEAVSLINLGAIAEAESDYERAQEYYEQSLEIARELGDRQSEAKTLGNLGLVAQAESDYEAAQEYHQRSLAVAQEIGDRQIEIGALDNLGNVARHKGEYEDAKEYLCQCLEIARELGDRQSEAKTLGNLGIVAHEQGNHDEAEEYLREALNVDPESAEVRHRLAVLLTERGATAEALAEYERVLDGDPGNAAAYFEYAALAVEADRHDEALVQLSELLDVTIDAGRGADLVGAVHEQLDGVVEPLLANATDRERARAVLELLVRLAERTTGAASEDLRLWSYASFAQWFEVPHDRAYPDADDPATGVVDGYSTGLGFLLAGEPETAVQFFRRAWAAREESTAADRGYAVSAGVGLLGCAELLGPSILDDDPEAIRRELAAESDAPRAPARRFLERLDDDPPAGDVAEAVHDDDHEQFSTLEAEAFAALHAQLRRTPNS